MDAPLEERIGNRTHGATLGECKQWANEVFFMHQYTSKLEAENERLRTTGEKAWVHMFDDIPKKFNAKRRAYEKFYEALGGE